MSIYKTKLGFDIKAVLTDIFRNDLKWDWFDSSGSGGASWFQDPVYGEQSYGYSFFSNKKIEIIISLASVVCSCEDLSINSCNCEEEAENEFTDWAEYWNQTNEFITLSEGEVKKILRPNLFE